MAGNAEEDAEGNAEGNAEAAALTYERARDELVDVVRRLEAGGLTLEESLRLWERGERLANVCAEWLEGARARLAEAIAGPAASEERTARDGPPNGPTAGERPDEAPF